MLSGPMKLLVVLIYITNASLTAAVLRSDREILDEYKNSDKYIRGEDYYIKKRPTNKQRSDLTYFDNWPNNTIPFIISDNITQDLVAEIMGAIKFLNNYTCLNFRPLDLEKDLYWIRFLKQDPSALSCASVIGFEEKPDQAVFIGDLESCKAPTIVHELLHTIGLFHEHQRNDRDKYITMKWKWVEPEVTDQFITETELCVKNGIPERQCTFNTYGLNYNYESIMHYCITCGSISPNRPAFLLLRNATNFLGKPTRIGQQYTLSEGDWLLINRKYGCDPDKNPQIRRPPQIPDTIPDNQLRQAEYSAIQPDYSLLATTSERQTIRGITEKPIRDKSLAAEGLKNSTSGCCDCCSWWSCFWNLF